MNSLSKAICFFASLIVMPAPTALAQHENHGSEQARLGLGQSLPEAKNQSLHPAWRLYAFDRDGITYYQVNDSRDRVHIVIAKANDVFWRLPAGDASAKISLPSSPSRTLPGAAPLYIYKDSEFALMLHQDRPNYMWSVELSN